MTKKIKTINKKHLFWVVPLMLLIGLTFGIIIGIPKHIDIEIDYGEDVMTFIDWADNVVNNASHQVAPIWACHDGCIFAEWFMYGGKGALAEQSDLY